MVHNTPPIVGQHGYFDSRLEKKDGSMLSRNSRYIIDTDKYSNSGCHYSTEELMENTPFITYKGIIKSVRKV